MVILDWLLFVETPDDGVFDFCIDSRLMMGNGFNIQTDAIVAYEHELSTPELRIFIFEQNFLFGWELWN